MTSRDDLPVQLVDILRADFRTSGHADARSAELQRALGLPFRYHPARLAIGLSLSDPDPPPPASDALGKPIKGETLLGHEEADLGLWTGLLVERTDRPAITRRQLQDSVAAHWQRGIERLWDHWTSADQRIEAFYQQLIRHAGPAPACAGMDTLRLNPENGTAL